MSYIINQIISLIKLLHSENGTAQIAAGLTIGLLLGLSPILSIQGIIFILCLLTFRVQIGAAFAMAGFTKVIAILLTPILASLGNWVLSLESLRNIFTSMYNLPLLPLTKFNHTVVMGGLVLSIILAPILYIIFHQLIKTYQLSVVEKIKNSKFYTTLKATTIIQWYLKYEKLTK